MSTMEQELPFYLKGTGQNLITPKLIHQFTATNPALATKIDQYSLSLKTLDLSHFESFCAWIISQQISGLVAEQLFNRLQLQLGVITPEVVLQTDTEVFRGIGLSKSKIEYLMNIADFFVKGKAIQNHENYSSEQILDHYCQIRGIGPWTVNMFLIFNLGRLDIAAPGDLVVRKGLKHLYDLPEIPSPNEARKLMQSWNELATIGTILSWAAMGE